MSSHDARLETGGFVPFYRSYTKTWIHAVATAGLTAFGTLTIVHRWFAALALASYVVPPIALYLRHGRGEGDRSDPERAEPDAPAKVDGPERDDSSGDTADATADERAADRRDRPSRGSPSAGVTAEGGAETAAETEPEAAAETETAGETETAEASESSETETAVTAGETAEWRAVDAPTAATLRDVAVAGAGGGSADRGAVSRAAYAVGDGGVVLAVAGDGDEGDGDGDGDEWSVVLEDGPAAGGNDLRGVDATADGGAVWVAGDSGALGRIDAETGRHTDYTAPEDVTDNWLGIAVGGASGAETILLINGSGAVLRGEYRGSGSDGGDGDSGDDGGAAALEWTGPDKPGSGSSFSGVALADETVGYCCDTNDGVFETTDGGESFERVGLEGADGTLTDVATADRGDCLASADDGVVHRYDGGSTWTPERVADGSLSGVARREDRAAASATDGAVHERAGPTADWERIETGAGTALLAVAIGPDRAVAVGEDGTIVARS